MCASKTRKETKEKRMRDPGCTALSEESSRGKSQEGINGAGPENKSTLGWEDKVPQEGSFFNRTPHWMKSMKKKMRM